MNKLITALAHDRGEDGASAVEYGLLVAAIAAIIVIIVFSLGGIIHDVFRNTCDNIDSNTTTTTTCSG
ncbi:MAG: Flp family type IVb pilin [Marmoricola sp.]